MKYYPHTPGEVESMLESIGAPSVDSLFSDISPDKKMDSLDMPAPLSEQELMKRIVGMAVRNRPFYDKPCFLGAGIYRHFTPAVVDAVISRSEFYTAYTPYQAEASQGVLQSIFEYQTMICMLTGMDVSNASVYDGATACAEGVSMALNQTRKKEVLISQGLHPEYAATICTYFKNAPSVVLKEVPLKAGVTCRDTMKSMMGKNTAGVVVQSPNCLGYLEDLEAVGKEIKEANKKTMFIVSVAEPHSLGVLRNPGDCGADVAVGEGAGLGLPPSFGGPHLGFMAAKSKYMRKIPGRLVGQTVDKDGKRAFCLTLQAREQHIRRDKAVSNICTNQALCALAATVYLAYLGKDGFYNLGKLNMDKAHYLKKRLEEIDGFDEMTGQPFFNEFTVKCPDDPEKIDLYLRKKGIIGGFVTGKWHPRWKNFITFSVTEMNSRKEIDDLADALKSYCREEVGTACTTS